jgi:mannose-6-phosphate isomerase-like protein (cupin superfamily)
MDSARVRSIRRRAHRFCGKAAARVGPISDVVCLPVSETRRKSERRSDVEEGAVAYRDRFTTKAGEDYKGMAMKTIGEDHVLHLSESSSKFSRVHAFEIDAVKERLREAGGGYEVVHESAGLELGVYVLVAPEPDRQQPHEDDEVYVALEGTGVLEVDGQQVPVKEGSAVFVKAGADHRFTAYEHLCVLVIFERRTT